MKLIHFEPWSRRWRAHCGSQIFEKLLAAEFSKPSRTGHFFDVQIHRWSAKKQKWIDMGISGFGVPHEQVVKVVKGKLVTTKSTIEMKLTSYGIRTYDVGVLCYKAAQIHYCAPSKSF